MDFLRAASIGTLVILSASTTAMALQTSPAASVYRSQYGDLKSKAVSLLDRAEQSRSNSSALIDEQLALLKLVHRLEEQASSDNADRAGRGQQSDKGLVLVAQACKALDFALAATANYVGSGDRSFIQLSRQGLSLADSVERLF